MTDIRKTACVIGASGLVGKALVQQLLSHPGYKTVTCLVRRPLNAADYPDPEGKLQPVVIDFDVLQDYQGYFTVDHVYCALGTTIKKAGSRSAFRRVDFEFIHVCAQLARAQRARGFVWVSSVGADKHSKNFYLKVKGELESSIMSMPQLEHAVAVKPSLLIGQRNEYRRLEQWGIVLANALSFCFIGPLAKYKPVHATTVAAQMIKLQPL
ncbi:MAG: Uncharacterised protein [Glaciecola sp. HTCC2999]|nr:MAG: Uncharacterised protein [Glaciecola sp. HTCC2999]